VSKESLYLGAQGEGAAVKFLQDNNYKILARNYKTKLGEIDIIARDKGVLVFVEVKTRNSDRFGAPAEALISRKRRQISKVALGFLKENNLLDSKARFDVVSVLCLADGSSKTDLIKNAFELESNFTY